MLNINKTVIAKHNHCQYLITFEKPLNFSTIKEASAAPNGTVWLCNNYNFFEKNEHGARKRLQVLFVTDLQKFKASNFYQGATFTKLNYHSYAMGLHPKIIVQK